MTTALIQDLKAGLMADFSKTSHPSMVYGFDNEPLIFGNVGTAYGYVAEGTANIKAGCRDYTIEAGNYFSFLTDGVFAVQGECKGFVVNRLHYEGFNTVGGPIEKQGRLKYIDGCSDSLLIGPPVKGDPCLNLLHFPKGIDQTMHTHPTIRAGLIHQGSGVCNTAEGPMELHEGRMFILYPDAEHAFSTLNTDGMTLTVYHPDTDTGPWHDDHPMLNRTIVEGVSASKIDRIRTKDIKNA